MLTSQDYTDLWAYYQVRPWDEMRTHDVPSAQLAAMVGNAFAKGGTPLQAADFLPSAGEIRANPENDDPASIFGDM